MCQCKNKQTYIDILNGLKLIQESIQLGFEAKALVELDRLQQVCKQKLEESSC